ncbi:MAG: DUF4199 domain-containing protein, partial [Bacteroidales bacterium]|nr:DUF4199 domain-containing protein [Bacteroidales bacterium]
WKGVMNPAIMLGFALIIYSLILYFFDQTFNKTLGYVSILIIIIGVVLGIKSFRNESRGGILSYGQAVGAGTIIGLYAGIIGAIFTFLLYKLIDPDLMEKMYTFMEEQMIEKGNIPEEMIEQSMEVTKKLMSPLVISLGVIFTYVFYGVIVSLIAGIFLKKEGDAYQKDMAEVEDTSTE